TATLGIFSTPTPSLSNSSTYKRYTTSLGTYILHGLGQQVEATSSNESTGSGSAAPTTETVTLEDVSPSPKTLSSSTTNSSSRSTSTELFAVVPVPAASATNSSDSSDPASACNVALQSFTSRYGSIIIQTRYDQESSLSIRNITPANATEFTLCDHYPRAHGTPTYINHYVNWTHTYTDDTTTVLPGVTPPACSIGSSACNSLWSVWYRNISLPEPACVSPPYEATTTACNITQADTIYNIPEFPPCTFEGGGGHVRLLYFPVTTKGDICNRTTIPGTPTGDGPNLVTWSGS
ncbi:hypothetical protein EV356DRAFT_571669, partial [Viridothelium virens]